MFAGILGAALSGIAFLLLAWKCKEQDCIGASIACFGLAVYIITMAAGMTIQLLMEA